MQFHKATMGYAQLVIGPAGSGKVICCIPLPFPQLNVEILIQCACFSLSISLPIARICTNTVKLHGEQYML